MNCLSWGHPRPQDRVWAERCSRCYAFEIIGDAQYRRHDQPMMWDSPIRFTPYKHFLYINGLTLPVLTLEFEYESYRRLGRVAKIRLLGEWLGIAT